jgi:hypothetical protein
MPSDVAYVIESDEALLKQRIDREAYALFSGRPEKGGASEIVRLIGKRAEDAAKRKLEAARARARERQAEPRMAVGAKGERLREFTRRSS